MKIIICIKQVPYVDQLKFDATTKRVIRDGVGTEINPFDKRAISYAIKLRGQFGGEVIALSMGPPQAKDALVEALAMGCDRAVLISGREFAGSDTLATARALAFACQKIGFDLILCGKHSTDAETAQVPPMLAEMLDIPQITGAASLEFAEDRRHFSAVRETDDGLETIQSLIPALLSASDRLAKPIKIRPDALEPARQKPIEALGTLDLAQDVSGFGLSGSATSVSEIFRIEPKRKRILRTLDVNLEVVVRDTVSDLSNEGLFGVWKNTNRHTIQPGQIRVAKEKAVWVVAELMARKIRPVTLEIMGRAVEIADTIGGEVAVVLVGYNVSTHVNPLMAYGADKVYVADGSGLEPYSTDGYTALLADAIRTYDPYAVLFPSTANGRDLAPRLATRLNLGLTGDCIGLQVDDQQRLVALKPAFGGNIIAPILCRTRPVMATVRPGILQSAEPDFSRVGVRLALSIPDLGQIRTHTIKVERNASESTQLDEAQIVIGVGMGVGGVQNLPMVQDLATSLGAAVGATRRVIDSGWLPPQAQIGITGKSISPNLYIALGVSGQFNHIVGVQRAGLILAINKDPKAEIFNTCDYGIVGDLMVIVPALLQHLKQIKPTAVRILSLSKDAS